MDWPMLFAFTGVLIILLGVLFFLLIQSKRLIAIMEKNNQLDQTILEVSQTNHRILNALKLLTKHTEDVEIENFMERSKRVKEEKERQRIL